MSYVVNSLHCLYALDLFYCSTLKINHKSFSITMSYVVSSLNCLHALVLFSLTLLHAPLSILKLLFVSLSIKVRMRCFILV